MNDRLGKIAIVATTFACGMLLSVDLSAQRTFSLSIESAEARVCPPRTPVSVAGVACRQYRRPAYGYGYGYGTAAISTGLVVVPATLAIPPWGHYVDQPHWGDPNNPGVYYSTNYYGTGY